MTKLRDNQNEHHLTQQFPKCPCGDIGVALYQIVVKYNMRVYKKWGTSGTVGTLAVIICLDNCHYSLEVKWINVR